MSFSSGTFTLVAGNPTVTGTTITSTWANNTLSDIATGLTTCLLKDGTQTATASIPFAQGLSSAAASPQLTLGVLNTTSGGIKFFGSTSGNVTLVPNVAAGSSVTVTLPATTCTLNDGSALTGTAISLAGGTTQTAFANATVQLTLGGTGATSVLAIPGTLDASGTTGSVTLAGGMYVAKAGIFTGALTAASLSTGSGAISGGAGTFSGILAATGTGWIRTSGTIQAASANTLNLDFGSGARIIAYGANAGAYPALTLTVAHSDGSNSVNYGFTSTGLQLGAVGAFVASDKYLVIDASGNIHVSATGPAS